MSDVIEIRHQKSVFWSEILPEFLSEFLSELLMYNKDFWFIIRYREFDIRNPPHEVAKSALKDLNMFVTYITSEMSFSIDSRFRYMKQGQNSKH